LGDLGFVEHFDPKAVEAIAGGNARRLLAI
jgi:hypothetical protein